jgi:hypothetical protein
MNAADQLCHDLPQDDTPKRSGCKTHMSLDRLGFLGLVVLIIAVTGAWTFLIGVAARNHPDNPLSQAAVHFWSGQ